MKEFKIKDLLVVKEKSGLWKFIALTGKGSNRMVRVQSALDEDKYETVKYDLVSSIENYGIFLKGGERKSLEDVISFIMGLEEEGVCTREELDRYEKLSPADKPALMEKLVPNHDPEQFKPYHLTKIIKWYKEIDDILSKMEAKMETDPFETPEAKELLEDLENISKPLDKQITL